VLGGDSTIAAFDETVSLMRPGSIVRVEVPGELPALSYPIDRKLRYTDDVLDSKGRTYVYRKGPQPAELGGQRALDFVLDNRTLQGAGNVVVCCALATERGSISLARQCRLSDFNRTLLFDIRLLSVRRKK